MPLRGTATGRRADARSVNRGGHHGVPRRRLQAQPRRATRRLEPVVSCSRCGPEQRPAPLARRRLTHLSASPALGRSPCAAFQQQPDDALLLLACVLRTAPPSPGSLNGKVQGRQPRLVWPPRVGAAIQQRRTAGNDRVRTARCRGAARFIRALGTAPADRGTRLSRPGRSDPSGWRPPRSEGARLPGGFSRGDPPPAQRGVPRPDAETRQQPYGGPCRPRKDSEGFPGKRRPVPPGVSRPLQPAQWQERGWPPSGETRRQRLHSRQVERNQERPGPWFASVG